MLITWWRKERNARASRVNEGDGLSSRTFYKTPLGAGSHTIPIVQTAKTETSKDLIPNTDKDAFFFRSLEKQGIYLNEPQIHAVRHFKGPLLALAGAGSGKTSVLVCRTGYLIAVRNINPKNILLVMFSKKAAEEMRDRIAHLPGMDENIAATIQARTFHSFLLKIIRKHGVTQVILSETRYQHILLQRMKRTWRTLIKQNRYCPLSCCCLAFS